MNDSTFSIIDSDGFSGADLEDELLKENALLEAWRVCYLANYFTFSFYQHLEMKFNITRPEWVTLFCLAHLEPLCAQDIVNKTWQPKNSINRGVNLLAEKGLIVKTQNPEDGRKIMLELTKEGWKTYSHMLPYAIKRKDRLIFNLSHEELRILNQILAKMCAYASQEPKGLADDD